MLLTIPQAAEKLELSRQRVHKLVTEGRIEARRVGRDYMIESAELTRFRRIPRTNGRKNNSQGRTRKGTR